MAKIDTNLYPNWIRGSIAVIGLMEQLIDMSDEEINEMCDLLLDKNAFKVTITLETKDSVDYWFKFTDLYEPEFDQSIGRFKDEKEDRLNVFHGIPYPVLLTMMEKDADKKEIFCTYVSLMKYVLIWQTIILLNQNSKKYPENDSNDFNDPLIYYTYADQLMSMLCFLDDTEHSESNRKKIANLIETRFNTLIQKTNKKDFKKQLNKEFGDNIAIENLNDYVDQITEENFEKLIVYLKTQFLIANTLIKHNGQA